MLVGWDSAHRLRRCRTTDGPDPDPNGMGFLQVGSPAHPRQTQRRFWVTRGSKCYGQRNVPLPGCEYLLAAFIVAVHQFPMLDQDRRILVLKADQPAGRYHADNRLMPSKLRPHRLPWPALPGLRFVGNARPIADLDGPVGDHPLGRRLGCGRRSPMPPPPVPRRRIGRP